MRTVPGRLRVLVIAEACNPAWSSVPLVGYNFAAALAARSDLDITLVTHVRNRPGLALDPLAQQVPIHYIDNEWLTGPLFRLGKKLRGGTSLSWTTGTALAWPGYMAFESAVYQQFRRALHAGRFDLIHRLTPLTPTIPSPLAGWTTTPMIVGPLNGGLPWPSEFPELRQQEREWLSPWRSAYRHLPGYRASYRHLAGVIAGSRHTATEIPRWFRGRRYYLPENGVDPVRFPLADDWPAPDGPLQYITVGRLVPYKGTDLTLEAMAGSPLLRTTRLCIVGDGPERGRLEALVAAHGLEQCVRFTGWLSQAEVGHELRRSQAFVFPSLREFGGGVVLEAMAAGLPCVVVDHGGPAELIDAACGTALPLGNREELIVRLRMAMEELVRHPDRTRARGQAGCRRVREQFTWEQKASRLTTIYQEVLTGSAAREVERCSTPCLSV
jgi:glycosyltransferase involved in cell wall biosynthesis